MADLTQTPVSVANIKAMIPNIQGMIDAGVETTLTISETSKPAGTEYVVGETITWQITLQNTGTIVQKTVKMTANLGTLTLTSYPSGRTYKVSGTTFTADLFNSGDKYVFNLKYPITKSDVGSAPKIAQIVYSSLNSNKTAASTSKAITQVYIPASSAEFNTLSWSEIDKLAKEVMKEPSKYSYMLGWTKDIAFGSPINKTITHEIVDICHTDWGSNHAFVFLPKEEVLDSEVKMFRTYKSNQYYTYSTSSITNLIDEGLQQDGTYWIALPSGLASVMKDCNIKVAKSSSAVQTITRKWFPPAAMELGLVGWISSGNVGRLEGEAFSYFGSTDHDKRVKKSSGTAVVWWTRSFYSSQASGNTQYHGVKETGGHTTAVFTSEAHGLVPCFAI